MIILGYAPIPMRFAIVGILVAAVAALLYLALGNPESAARVGRGSQAPAEGVTAAKPAAEKAEKDEDKAPGLTLRGTVVTGGDEPVQGAEVRLRVWSAETDDYKDRSARVRTDAQGAFELTAERAEHMMLRATHPEYMATDLYVDQASAVDSLRIVMLRGAPLTVVVKQPDQSPAPGIEVGGYLLRLIPGERWYYRVTLDTVTTDADGIAAMGAVAEGTVSLWVGPEGYAPAGVRREIKGLDPVVIEIVLDRGGAAEGKVTSPDGKPVAGAKVHMQQSKLNAATTDEHGYYRIEGLPAWGVEIIAEATGFGPGYFGDGLGWGKPVPLAVESGATEHEVDIVLSLANYVTGRIVDGKDLPVADAQVIASVRPGFTTKSNAKTDSDGRFRCGPYALKREAEVSILINAKRHTLPDVKPRRILPGRDLDFGTLKAKRRATVRGIVFDLDGSPLRRGRVSGSGASTNVKPDGTFELNGLAAGKNRIVAWGTADTRPHSHPHDIEIEAGGLIEGVELRIVEPLSIEGRLLTTDGKPRAGVDLIVVAEGKQPPLRWGTDILQEVETGKDGAFRFASLLPGRYTIGARERKDGDYRFRDEPAPIVVEAGAVDIVMRWPLEGGTILGRVLDKQTGLPLATFDVTLYQIVLFFPRYRDNADFNSAAGTFRVDTQKPGIYAIEVEAEGHAPFRTQPKAVKKGAEIDFGDIKLGYAGSVKGTVRDHAGRPVRWAKIHLLSPKLETNFDAPMTDKRGGYEVKGLAPGKYTLFAVSPRHPLALVNSIEIEENRATKVDISFAASAPITLRIVDEQSQPVAGAKLIWTFDAIKPIDSSMVRGREPPGYGSNIADTDGVIKKPYFPAGPVYLKIEADGFVTASHTVELEPGQPKEVEIRLARKP